MAPAVVADCCLPELADAALVFEALISCISFKLCCQQLIRLHLAQDGKAYINCNSLLNASAVAAAGRTTGQRLVRRPRTTSQPWWSKSLIASNASSSDLSDSSSCRVTCSAAAVAAGSEAGNQSWVAADAAGNCCVSSCPAGHLRFAGLGFCVMRTVLCTGSNKPVVAAIWLWIQQKPAVHRTCVDTCVVSTC